jgi:hypothetical protein
LIKHILILRNRECTLKGFRAVSVGTAPKFCNVCSWLSLPQTCSIRRSPRRYCIFHFSISIEI